MKRENTRISGRIRNLLACVTSSVLGVVLFMCANTTSCTMVYQPETPAGLEKFSKVK